MQEEESLLFDPPMKYSKFLSTVNFRHRYNFEKMNGADDDELENLPTIKEILDNPVTYDAFYWFQVSRFAPENLLFRTAVSQYKKAVSCGGADKVGKFIFFSCDHCFLIFFLLLFSLSLFSSSRYKGQKGERLRGQHVFV